MEVVGQLWVQSRHYRCNRSRSEIGMLPVQLDEFRLPSLGPVAFAECFQNLDLPPLDRRDLALRASNMSQMLSAA